jgi:hypothetical protein
MAALGYEFVTSVSIHLLVAGTEIAVEQTSGESLVIAHPFSVPPGEGTLVLKVDDREERRRVYLPDGISPDRLEQPIVLLDTPPA